MAFTFFAFMSGLAVFSFIGTNRGLGLPEARKEAVSLRQGSSHSPRHRRAGRFWFFHRGK